MQRLQESIDEAQLWADMSKHSGIQSDSLESKATRTALRLKDEMHELMKHVTSYARVIGWLEFEHDDAQGRLEYIGQLIREDDDGTDGAEDGLGHMTW